MIPIKTINFTPSPKSSSRFVADKFTFPSGNYWIITLILKMALFQICTHPNDNLQIVIVISLRIESYPGYYQKFCQNHLLEFDYLCKVI